MRNIQIDVRIANATRFFRNVSIVYTNNGNGNTDSYMLIKVPLTDQV